MAESRFAAAFRRLAIQPDRLGPAILAAVGTLVVLAAAVAWLWRVRQSAEMREVLQKEAPIARPPAEIQIPVHLPDTARIRQALAPGTNSGYWVIGDRRRPGTIQVILTREGQKYFSTVGESIVGGFSAGTREIQKVPEVTDADSTRKVTFQFVWRSLHPAMGIFGELSPKVDQQYRGEALLVERDGNWTVAHWTTPELDAAYDLFRKLTEPNEKTK